ncbi:hypothetical protein [Isoptericola sp. NPDC055881]
MSAVDRAIEAMMTVPLGGRVDPPYKARLARVVFESIDVEEQARAVFIGRQVDPRFKVLAATMWDQNRVPQVRDALIADLRAAKAHLLDGAS